MKTPWEQAIAEAQKQCPIKVRRLKDGRIRGGDCAEAERVDAWIRGFAYAALGVVEHEFELRAEFADRSFWAGYEAGAKAAAERRARDHDPSA